MSKGHECYITGSSAVCIERNNELWVKEYADRTMREGRTYRVNFCPECGHKMPPKGSFWNFFASSIPDADDSISRYSQELSNSINLINRNIDAMKAFMMSQNLQNEIFVERQNDFEKRISDLEIEEIPF